MEISVNSKGSGDAACMWVLYASMRRSFCKCAIWSREGAPWSVRMNTWGRQASQVTMESVDTLPQAERWGCI